MPSMEQKRMFADLKKLLVCKLEASGESEAVNRGQKLGNNVNVLQIGWNLMYVHLCKSISFLYIMQNLLRKSSCTHNIISIVLWRLLHILRGLTYTFHLQDPLRFLEGIGEFGWDFCPCCSNFLCIDFHLYTKFLKIFTKLVYSPHKIGLTISVDLW